MSFDPTFDRKDKTLDERHAELQRNTMKNEVQDFFRQRESMTPIQDRSAQAHLFFQSSPNGDASHFVDWSLYLTEYKSWLPGVHGGFEELVSRLWSKEILEDCQAGMLPTRDELAKWEKGCNEHSRRREAMCELFTRLRGLGGLRSRPYVHGIYTEDDEGTSLTLGAQPEPGLVVKRKVDHSETPFPAPRPNSPTTSVILPDISQTLLPNTASSELSTAQSHSSSQSNVSPASHHALPTRSHSPRCQCPWPDCSYETRSASHLNRHKESVHKQGCIYVCPYEQAYCRARAKKKTTDGRYWDTRADNFKRHLLKCHGATGFADKTAMQQREIIDNCKQSRDSVVFADGDSGDEGEA